MVVTKDDLKKERTKQKAALTRMESRLRKYVAEEEMQLTVDLMTEFKKEYISFEKVHDAYHAELTDDKELEECAKYIVEVELKYAQCYSEVRSWIRIVLDKKIKIEQDAKDLLVKKKTETSVLSPEMLSVIGLPKLELCPYDGDPLQYYPFITAFDETVDAIAVSGSAKLNRLVNSSKGPVLAAIQSCLIVGGDKGYHMARGILKERFGNDLIIEQAVIGLLSSGSQVKTSSDLRRLSDELTSCDIVLLRLGGTQEVESQRFITSVVERLQPYLKGKWKKMAMDMKKKTNRYPDFGKLVSFVKEEANNACDPIYGDSGLLKFNRGGANHSPGFNPRSGASSQPRYGEHSKSPGTTFVTEGRTFSPCKFCGESHRIYMCSGFRALRAEQKLDFIVKSKLCENCLLDNHQVQSCFRPSMCGIDGCVLMHSRFIHRCKIGSSTGASSSSNRVQFTSAFTQKNSHVCVPIVEVKVNNRINSAVMLDTCSTTTFCSKSLVDQLGLRGIPIQFELSTLTSTSQFKETRVIPVMYVESRSQGNSLCLRNVFVIDSIPNSKSEVQIGCHEHLAGIDVVAFSNNVDILIGQDNAEALIPLEVRRGRLDEPFAVRTMLGWSLHGNTSSHSDVCGLVRAGRVSCKIVSNFIQSDSVDSSEFSRLEDKVDNLWRLDQEGLAGVDKVMSCEDTQVLKLWDEHVQFVGGHYELPIPWKEDVQVPDNFQVAESRLKSLRQSLDKRDSLDRYDVEIQKLLTNKYAETVKTQIQNYSSKIWYLPHHGVVSDKKPGKLRVVFDCAARFQGESLNDKCKQGPDLNNKLVHVLLRFRQHSLAIMADVEAMYYQVKVSEGDRDALRFLWYDKQGEVVVHRMCGHIFGGVWCASIATYAIQRTVEDQAVEDEFVRDVVKRSFYVDDCLRSISSLEEAEKIVVDVKQILKKGGFNLTKFTTNSKKIAEMIREEDKAKEVKEFGEVVENKALGVRWDIEEDVLKVTVDVKKKEVTRKTMLSVIASMYDPLGLVSPCIITGRMIFQEATRLKLGWDEEIPGHISTRWIQWLQSLEKLNDVSFPRCMKPEEEGATYEIHNFSDASQKGYGCCSYLRSISKDGGICVSLIASKAKVCPMKHVTIPRLELQAALMSAQVHEMISRELDLPIVKSYFWVDSKIVLAYIQNKKKRLKIYVDNRVSMIHSLSEAKQWGFVPGTENPADLISRGVDPKELSSSKWREGPSFLQEDQKKNNSPDYEIPSKDEEVKEEVAVRMCAVEEQNPIEKIAKHFSSWYKVKRAVAWLMKIRRRLVEKKKERRKEEIEVEDLRRAEELIVKYIQSKKYDQEIKMLKSKSMVQKSSSIRSLLPMLNEEGILCVGGRIKQAKSQDVCKHPFILPHDSPVTVLIVREYHEKAHQGTEWTLSLLRQRFWITKSRRVIKQVKQRCVTCKKLYDQPRNQLMADLPGERLKAVKPFQHVGIDCFGPFYIKQGRAEVKRYGCIYTCMNMRAIHIEKLNSLETDSFINGFRRFMARRGTPVKVWSDNGTNFVGGSPEIIKCMEKLDEEKIKNYGLKKGVEWKFNPPHASNMGGVWERQIRTIRKILSSLIEKHTEKLTDEVLETFFCEVEVMVNSRPLTKLSEDVTDMSTLSPNQLLILNDESTDFPGRFQKSDMYKLRWKFIQYLSNQFWKRWLKEYIPELQRRSKWCLKQDEVRVGDVVLLFEENTPRFLWPLGLIIEVKVGRDKLVRTVRVKTKSTVLVRPVSKVVRLEC